MSNLLRILVVVAVFAFAVDSATKTEVDSLTDRESRIYENRIKNAIEKLLKKLKDEGIPSQNIPSLDPLHVDDYHGTMQNVLAKLDVDLKDSEFTGLTDVDIPTLSFKLAGMVFDMGLKWKYIHGVGSYGMKGTFGGLFPMFGNGNFNVNITDFLVNVSTKLGSDENKFLYLKDFKVQISVGKTDVHLTGLYNNEKLSDFTSQLISQKLPGLINKFKGTISMLLSPKIAAIGNKFLENKTINDIIGGLGKNDQVNQITL